jgi:hypothetical protein
VASALWNIRELYLSLLTDMISNAIAKETARQRRDSLQEELSAIYLGAPRTLTRAYREAQKALKVNEELTFSEQEIDSLLPPLLRKQPK